MALVIAVLGLSFKPQSTYAAASQPFTLQPGGVATITFEAYCTEFGKFFPQTIVEPNGQLASDPIRAALVYIDQQGYSADEAQALEANYAIWQLAGATRAPAGGDITKDVIANATTPPADPAGTSVLEAASAGQVKLTITSWAAIGPKVQILSATDNFYGRGTMTVENTSQQALSLYMPVGTLFPGDEARFQLVGGYATDVQVTNPQLPATGEADQAPIATLLAAAAGLLALGIGMVRRSRIRVLP
jgi:LPXTG-motif cell wall-anchored protein